MNQECCDGGAELLKWPKHFIFESKFKTSEAVRRSNVYRMGSSKWKVQQQWKH